MQYYIKHRHAGLQPEDFVGHDPDGYFCGHSSLPDNEGRVPLFIWCCLSRNGFSGKADHDEIAYYLGDSPQGLTNVKNLSGAIAKQNEYYKTSTCAKNREFEKIIKYIPC